MGGGYGFAYVAGAMYKGDLLSNSAGFLVYPANNINHENGTCLRLGVKPEHGLGWCLYENGEHWLWPMPFIQPQEIEDDNQLKRPVILDELSGRFWEFPTRNGPTGSGLTATYLDKDGRYEGAEIPTEIIFKEQTGTKQYEALEHEESHAYIEPMQNEDKGSAGHNSNGLRTAQTIDYGFYKGGEISETVRAKDIPDNGEITHDRKVEDRRLQPFIATTTSEYKLRAIDNAYNMKDRAGTRSEKTMKEHIWQSEYDSPLFWITRCFVPLTNHAKGKVASGTYFSTTTGMDGNDDSAIVLSGTDTPNDSIDPLTGDFTIQFACKDITSGTVLVMVTGGNLRIGITFDVLANDYYITYTDGIDAFNQYLNWNGSDYILIKITRSGTSVKIAKNGVLLNTISLSVLTVYNGNVVLNVGGGINTLFDVCVGGNAISDEAGLYYYNDLTVNSGNSVLPIF